MLRWSHHVDIFGTLHFIVRCLADRSEGPLPPCSCRRRRCSCIPSASVSSPTPAMDLDSRPNHVDSWSPAREELVGKHTYIHTSSSSSSCVRIISSLPNLGFTSLCLAASTSGSAVHVPLLHHPIFVHSSSLRNCAGRYRDTAGC